MSQDIFNNPNAIAQISVMQNPGKNLKDLQPAEMKKAELALIKACKQIGLVRCNLRFMNTLQCYQELYCPDVPVFILAQIITNGDCQHPDKKGAQWAHATKVFLDGRSELNAKKREFTFTTGTS